MAKAIVVLLIIDLVVQVITLIVTLSVTGSARDFLDGSLSKDDFETRYAAYGVTSLATGVLQLALAVLTMIWMFRVASNERAVGRKGTFGPGWGIAGWFLPPFLFVIPFLMLRQLWKASDPDVPLGGEWRNRPVHAVVTAWFVLYGVLPLVLTIAGARSVISGFTAGSGDDTRDLAETLDDQLLINLGNSVLLILAAIAFIALVRQLTARTQQLTGETAR